MFPAVISDSSYVQSQKLISNMKKVVDSLY